MSASTAQRVARFAIAGMHLPPEGVTRALEADEARLDQLNQSIEQSTAAADAAHRALADAAASLRL